MSSCWSLSLSLQRTKTPADISVSSGSWRCCTWCCLPQVASHRNEKFLLIAGLDSSVYSMAGGVHHQEHPRCRSSTPGNSVCAHFCEQFTLKCRPISKCGHESATHDFFSETNPIASQRDDVAQISLREGRKNHHWWASLQ